MNAPLSKEQLARLAGGSVAYHGQYVEGLTAPVSALSREGALTRWLRSLGTRVEAYRQRRTVLNELGQLSDRELADIGLSRGQLYRVFDPEFARAHGAGAPL